MKRIISICILLAAVCINSFAQMDEREPGLYAINPLNESKLTPQGASKSNKSNAVFGIEIGNAKLLYKGVSSDTSASGKFIMVIDPEQKAIKQTLKEYDVFVKSMTPDNMIIVPLEVEKNRRVYCEGKTINGFNTEKKDRVPFTWEQITDNSFVIYADVTPGEYAIVFRPAKLGEYNFNTVFDFTVVFPEVEGAPEE